MKYPFIVKVPGINGLGHTKGCRNAGNEILAKLKEIYSNESGKIIEVEKLELEEIHVNNDDPEEANKLIYKNALDCFEEKEKTIFLGGDHSISFSLGEAFLDYCQKNGKEPCLIVFDAHPDLMPSADKKIPTHEEWLRQLIEEGFPKENILLVGVRNSDEKELNFIKENKIKRVAINSVLEDIDNIADTLMEFANGKETYVSVDIDVLDPVFAPGTYYCEPGGLTSRQLIYILQRINKVKNLKALDIVEINLEKDKQFNNLTSKVGAKILSELI
jgi:arginase family enzyme